MFRSMKDTAVKPSQIRDDAADLINEMDNLAPSDEIVTDTLPDDEEDLILVHSQVTTKQGVEVVPPSSPAIAEHQADNHHQDDSLHDEQRNSPDLSVQVSDLSLDDQLAFLEECIRQEDTTPSPPNIANLKDDANNLAARPLVTTDKKLAVSVETKDVQDKAVEEEGSNKKEESDESAAAANEEDDFKSAPPDDSQEEEEFNPFVNIGSRLYDSENDPEPGDDTNTNENNPTAPRTSILGLLSKLSLPTVFVLRMWWIVEWSFRSMTNQEATNTMEDDSYELITEELDLSWNSTLSMDNLPPGGVWKEVTLLPNDDAPSTDDVPMCMIITIMLATLSLLLVSRMCKAKQQRATTYRECCTKLSVQELKKELRSRNLSPTGIHSHLVDRLMNHQYRESNSSTSHYHVVEYSPNSKDKKRMDINVLLVKKNFTLETLREQLKERGLPRTGLKEDLITKVWIPARVKELQATKRDELRKMLKAHHLSPSGLKDALICRLIESGH